MKITVNRTEIDYQGEPTVAAFAGARQLPETGVAIAVNGEVVPRAEWPDQPLREGDELEVVTAMGGG